MRTVMIVHPEFDRTWPFAAERFRQLLSEDGPLEFVRLPAGCTRRAGDIVDRPETVDRLICLNVGITEACIRRFASLKEAVIEATHHQARPPEALIPLLEERRIRWYFQPTEGFWSQSVSEFALGLTICALRRIPQTHREMIESLNPWNYDAPNGIGTPGARGFQFGDDGRFANGTVAGKKVRIVGAGNIASRYASFVHMLGADVAAWDPFASEPCFHRAGARKVWYLEQLVADADIFVPLLPLTEQTREIVAAEHIRALPTGALVVLATRAGICDMNEIRRRVLADELSLAADVFDVEPVPLDDPLLGRHNVVHTPHNAGRTKEANDSYAEKLYEQFSRSPAG